MSVPPTGGAWGAIFTRPSEERPYKNVKYMYLLLKHYNFLMERATQKYFAPGPLNTLGTLLQVFLIVSVTLCSRLP